MVSIEKVLTPEKSGEHPGFKFHDLLTCNIKKKTIST